MTVTVTVVPLPVVSFAIFAAFTLVTLVGLAVGEIAFRVWREIAA